MAFRECADTSRLNRSLLTLKSLETRPIQVEVPIQHQFQQNQQQYQRQAQFQWSAATLPLSASEYDPKSIPRIKTTNGNRLSFSSASIIILGSAVCLWLLLFFLIFILYFNVSSTWTAYKEEIRPHVHDLATNFANVLRNLDSATSNANHMLTEADSLEHSIVPSISTMVNESAHIVEKLERISRNPVLKLSLSGE
jgi:hypothetical protein